MMWDKKADYGWKRHLLSLDCQKWDDLRPTVLAD